MILDLQIELWVSSQ